MEKRSAMTAWTAARRHRWTVGGLALAWLLVGEPVGARAQATRQPAAAQPAAAQPDAAQPQADTRAVAEYVIGPADVLQVVVWKEPELTRDTTVRLDGMVSLPLLGDVRAEGLTPAQFASELKKGLARFVESPRVTVTIAQSNSSRFYVVGQVVKPGEYPLSRRTTVLQGLAVAGGFREFAKLESILIVRQDQSVRPVNYKRLAEGRDLSQNVALRAGDTIVVP